ncbi:MAG: hypothetical protein R6X09_08810 [Bacteroidales bacterium]
MADIGNYSGPAGKLADFFTDLGNLIGFTADVIRKALKKKPEYREFLRQNYLVGYRSLPLVGIVANSSVVASSLAIFVIDLLVVQITELIL